MTIVFAQATYSFGENSIAGRVEVTASRPVMLTEDIQVRVRGG